MALRSGSSSSADQLLASLAWTPEGDTPPGEQARVTLGGRTVALDHVGLRHVDIPKGLARMSSTHLNFAVRWDELSRVTLEIVWNRGLSIVMGQTRTVLVPRDAAAFGTRHPDLEPMHGAGKVGPTAWALSLGLAKRPDQQVLDGLLDGLRRFAGPSLFSGQVDSFDQ